jgi:hypothetical protein
VGLALPLSRAGKLWSPLPAADLTPCTQKYPNARVSALSNSATQKLHIDATARERGLRNLEVFTGDVMTYDFAGRKA